MFDRNAPMAPPPGRNGDGRQVLSPAQFGAMVRRHRLMFSLITLACIAAAALYSVIARPLYSSEVFLRIEDSKRGESLLGDLPSLPGMTKQGEIETEMLVLRSRELAEGVVDSLRLRVAVRSPNRPRSALLEVHEAGRSAGEARVKLERTEDGRYAVSIHDAEPRLDAPPTVTPGEPFRLGDVIVSVKETGADEIEFELLGYRDAVEELRERLVVARPDQQAKIVKLGFSSHDSMLVAAVPNALARGFIDYKTMTTHSEELSTVEFLNEQVGSYESELAAAEERLRTFREARQVVSLTDQATEQVKRMAEYQAQRQELIQERDGLQRLLTRLDQDTTPGTAAYRQIASFPSFFSNRAVQDMLLALNELENDRAKALVLRTTSNADVESLNSRIRDIETQLYSLTRSYVGNLNNQIAATETVLRQFGGNMEQVPEVEMEFVRLARQQKLLEEIYTLLQTRLKEAEVRAAVEPGDVRVIDTALVPDESIAPRPVRNLILGLLVGLVLAATVVYIREKSNTKVRSKQDVLDIVGDLPVLGYVPHMQGAARGNGRRPGRRAGKGGVSDERTPVAALLNDAAAVEAYRSLRTNIRFMGHGDRTPIILITSSVPAEGKSTTATNLAMTLAREGKRILLIDADLRRGHVHSGLGLTREPGLAQVLVGELTLADAVHRVTLMEDTSLDVLTVGGYPPNAAELLAADSMRRLMDETREMYDMVIVDAPPVAAVTDAAVLTAAADSAILVVRSGHTPKGALEYTTAQLRQVGAPVRGVVINDIDRARDGAYYAYSYYEYETAG